MRFIFIVIVCLGISISESEASSAGKVLGLCSITCTPGKAKQWAEVDLRAMIAIDSSVYKASTYSTAGHLLSNLYSVNGDVVSPSPAFTEARKNYLSLSWLRSTFGSRWKLTRTDTIVYMHNNIVQLQKCANTSRCNVFAETLRRIKQDLKGKLNDREGGGQQQLDIVHLGLLNAILPDAGAPAD